MTNQLTPEQLAQAQAQMAQLFQAQAQAQQQPAPLAPAPAAAPAPYFAAPQAPAYQPPPPAAAGLLGILIPVTLRDRHGDDVPAHMLLAPGAAQDPTGAIEQLDRAGWAVKSYAPRRDDNRGDSYRRGGSSNYRR